MIPKSEPTVKYLLPALIIVALIMGILPLTHALFERTTKEETKLTQSHIKTNELPLKKKKPPQPKTRHIRRSLETSSEPTTTRKEQLAFTPDLSVGSEGGVEIENPELTAVIFEEDEADIAPKRLYFQPIEYPEQARERGIEGVVELLMVVSREGTVESLEFIKLPHPLFRNPISEQVKTWRFSPGHHKGVPVRVRVRQSFDFSLE